MNIGCEMSGSINCCNYFLDEVSSETLSKKAKINLSFSLNFEEVVRVQFSISFSLGKGKSFDETGLFVAPLTLQKAFDVSLLDSLSDYLSTLTACYEFRQI